MIEAKELRIGNYVIFGTETEPHKIESIYLDYSEIFTKGGYLIGTNNLEGEVTVHFKPIPLTEEWLIRFGYIQSYDGGYYAEFQIEFDANFIDLTCDSESTWFYRKDGNATRLDYVHQLQNLYYCLTGKELKTKQNETSTN